MSVDIVFQADPSDAVNASKKIQGEVNKIGSAGKQSGKAIDGIGASMNGFLKNALKAVSAVYLLRKALDAVGYIRKHVDEAEKLSRALEISYEKAQELSIAEREAGLAAGSIRSAIEGIAKAQGAGLLSRDLQDIGVSLDSIRNKTPAELFDEINQKFKEGGITGRQYRASLNILGDNASEVALKMAANFDYFRDVAKESGEIIAEDTFENLIKESDTFSASIEVIGEDVVRLITPFKSFGEAAGAALGTVNKLIESIRFHMVFVTSHIGGLLAGMTDAEATEFASSEALAAGDKIKKRAEQTNKSRASTENLTAETASGKLTFLDYLTKRQMSEGQNISSLQRVGLAATGGESEAIKLQRRQVAIGDSIVRTLVDQTTVIERTF